MAKIAVLSDELINKIAAGEVVERPASVVKELCENSVDAQARSLKVTLAGGGLARITVADDGHGMSREDAMLCLRRHATSKLRDVDGLFHILTKGFRGEAVPAIASVSRFTLTTSERGAALGTKITIEGGSEPVIEDAPPVEGTIIQVEDLFFNTPARRKFMKREQTELGHCEDALIRIALAHPGIAVRLEHEGNVLLTSPATESDVRERIAAALGPEVHPHLVEVDERRLGLSVTGFIASPAYTLGNARGIFTFVNGRYIRDRGLNHALQRSFQDTVPGGRQPVAVLFIQMDPRAVDVNVHPQKLEVRFADPRGIHDAVVSAVSRALKGSGWFAGADGSQGAGEEPVAGAHYAAAVERFLTRAQEAAWGAPLPIPSAADAPRMGATPSFFPPSAGQGNVGFGQLRPSLNEAPPKGYFSALRPLGMLARRFAICEGSGGTLVAVDPHAAFERTRATELATLLEDGADAAQRSLFAATVELTTAEAKVLQTHLVTLERIGIEAEPFGGSAFAVKSVPQLLSDVDAKDLLSALVTTLPSKPDADLPEWAPVISALACLSARGASRELTSQELRSLFDALERADFDRPCKHGRVVVFELPFLELEKRSRE